MRTPQIIPPLARFEAHPIRLLIQERLKRAAVGEVVTYTELSDEIGYDVRTTPHLIYYARDVLLDDGIVFDAVPSQGMKRVAGVGALAVAEGQGRRMLSTANRASRVAKTVDLDALTPGERIRFGVLQVRLGLTQQFGRRAMGARIAKAMGSGTDAKALVASSLEQFK